MVMEFHYLIFRVLVEIISKKWFFDCHKFELHYFWAEDIEALKQSDQEKL